MKPLPFRPAMRRLPAIQGHSFVVALMIILVISSLSAVAIMRTSGSARLNARAADYAEGERVADAIIDYAFGVWKKGIQNKDGELSSVDLANLHLTTPSIVNYSEITSAQDTNGPLKLVPAELWPSPCATISISTIFPAGAASSTITGRP